MVWIEPRDHIKDCYFCIVKVKGFNTNNKDAIKTSKKTCGERFVIIRCQNNILSKSGDKSVMLFLVKTMTLCIESVLNDLGVQNYRADEWRLFIDSSKRSLNIAQSRLPIQLKLRKHMTVSNEPWNLYLMIPVSGLSA